MADATPTPTKYRTLRLVSTGKKDKNNNPIIHPVGSIISPSDEDAADLLSTQAIAIATKEVAL